MHKWSKIFWGLDLGKKVNGGWCYLNDTPVCFKSKLSMAKSPIINCYWMIVIIKKIKGMSLTSQWDIPILWRCFSRGILLPGGEPPCPGLPIRSAFPVPQLYLFYLSFSLRYADRLIFSLWVNPPAAICHKKIFQGTVTSKCGCRGTAVWRQFWLGPCRTERAWSRWAILAVVPRSANLPRQSRMQ